MRGAVRNKIRWKGRRAPTQDPSTNHLLSRFYSQELPGLYGDFRTIEKDRLSAARDILLQASQVKSIADDDSNGDMQARPNPNQTASRPPRRPLLTPSANAW